MTLPLQLELEYMLQQRRLAQGPGGTLNEQRLRLRLRQIAQEVANQKVQELSELFGKPVRLWSQNTINNWINTETEAAREYVEKLNRATNGRQDAERSLIDIMRAAIRGQQEARASSAILTLNTELIEEIARGGGSTHYRWQTQMDDRVRAWHAALNGKLQTWNKAPLGGGTKAGDSGHPGSGYGCRCYPVPIQGVTPSRRPKKIPAKKRTIAEHAQEKLRTGLEIDTGYKGRLKPNMTLPEAENAIRDYKFEHAMAWDKNGNALIRITNRRKNSFRFTNEQFAQAVEKGIDTLTHNHPNGNPALSIKDILLASYGRIRVYRSTTAAKRGMELTVTKPRFYLLSRSGLRKELERVRDRAQAAAKDAAYEYKWIKHNDGIRRKNPLATTNGTQEVWINTYADEAERLYNELGEYHGFNVKSYTE